MQYESVDTIVTDGVEKVSTFPTEFLNEQTPSGMPPRKLNLKVGSIVMLNRNLNSRKGLLNGTILIVKTQHLHFIDAEILAGSNRGARVFIPKLV